MNFRRLQNFTFCAGILAAVSLAVPVHATTYSFSFDGMGPDPFGGGPVELSGFGSFSYTTSAAPLSPVNLTAFSLTDIFSPSHGPGTARWVYGLNDLSSFVYFPETFDFSLLTNSIPSLGPYYYNGALSIAGFGPNQVTIPSLGLVGPASITSFTATPEPSTYGLGFTFRAFLSPASSEKKALSITSQ